jgi:thiamine-phosphate pyrophosphorylase
MSRINLYLITPVVSDSAAFKPLLAAAVKATQIASIHLRLATMDDADVKRHVSHLASVVQDSGAALLLDPASDLRSIARWGADGAHVSNSINLKDTVDALKPDRIVGAGGLRTKDAAMAAGEDGCDYVMFGEPRPDGSLPPLEQVVDRCQWWAEVFNTPCVAYAPSLEAVKILAATGVEFVALGEWAFIGSPAQIGQTVAEAAEVLKSFSSRE